MASTIRRLHIARQEQRAIAYSPGGRQDKASSLACWAKSGAGSEPACHSHRPPWIARTGAAMNRDCVESRAPADNFMRLAIVHIGDEPTPQRHAHCLANKGLRGRQPRIEWIGPGKIGSVISHFPLNRAINHAINRAATETLARASMQVRRAASGKNEPRWLPGAPSPASPSR